MLNQLIESRTHKAENRQRGGFLLATFFVVGAMLSSGVLWSLFAKDLTISAENLELSALIAPVSTVENEPPAPMPKQQNRPQATQNAKVSLPTRTDNIARIDETQPAPDAVSVALNNAKSRPHGVFNLGPVDLDPTGSGSDHSRENSAGTENGIGEKPAPPQLLEKVPPPPPPPTVKKATEEVAQKPKPPISLGVINGKAQNLPVPVYPATAKAVGAAGNVDVQVLIDETGKVVSAQAVSGHPLLRDAAERAARGARFSPTTLSKQAVKVSGVIVYKFSK